MTRTDFPIREFYVAPRAFNSEIRGVDLEEGPGLDRSRKTFSWQRVANEDDRGNGIAARVVRCSVRLVIETLEETEKGNEGTAGGGGGGGVTSHGDSRWLVVTNRSTTTTRTTRTTTSRSGSDGESTKTTRSAVSFHGTR